MSLGPLDLLANGLLQTLAMTAGAAVICVVAGIPLAILLLLTDPDPLLPVAEQKRSSGKGKLRSTPFLILLIALIPLTRLSLGESNGVLAAVLPFSFAVAACSVHIAEVSLRRVNRSLVDAGLAMGASRFEILRHFILPEALPGILAGFTVALGTLVGASVIASAIGAVVFGELAAPSGYQLFRPEVIVNIVAAVIALAYVLQAAGSNLAQRLSHGS